MSTSINGGETYPGHSLSVPQLLYAVKRKLWDPAFGGRITNQIEVDAIEQDALEVLGLVRSMKNNFAPINKITPDVFSLIPGYFRNREMDKGLVAMTHVCHGWRELLIARPSLWTRLNCENTDKTRVYIERSKSLPLHISLHEGWSVHYLEDAFLLVVPHISRLRSLSIDGRPNVVENITPYISCPTPLLRELTIKSICRSTPVVLEGTLFNGDLSSLRELTLDKVITHLPWKNLSQLTNFTLSRVPRGTISITQFLDFFTNAHRLRDIQLNDSIPTVSNAPPGRVVSLPCLESLVISAGATHSALLNHLSIPVGASLLQRFCFHGDDSPLPDFLPKSVGNLKNVSSITSVNLYLDVAQKRVRLDGPSGRLCMDGYWTDIRDTTTSDFEGRVLRSLSYFVLSGTQRLAIAAYQPPKVDETDESAPYYILLRMDDLCTLTLNQCNNLPFIFALNPVQTRSKRTLCPKLEELILYIRDPEFFNNRELMTMAKERASAGKKLSSITIVGPSRLMPRKSIFDLTKYGTSVHYRVGEMPTIVLKMG